MIRKLTLPVLAIAVLGGCVTSGAYQYRGGTGDYYYGRPSVEYRYYPSPYGYGYPGYGYAPFGFSGYYGYGGYYGYPYSRYPYSGYPYYPGRYTYRPPHRHHDGDGRDDGGHHGSGGGDQDNTQPKPPWRNLDQLRERRPQPSTQPPRSIAPEAFVPARPASNPTLRGSGSTTTSGSLPTRTRDRDRRRRQDP